LGNGIERSLRSGCRVLTGQPRTAQGPSEEHKE
jgi:hypothetical protein